MERLRAAIEKARAERQAQGATAARGPARSQIPRPDGRPAAPDPDATIREAWAALEQITPRPAIMPQATGALGQAYGLLRARMLQQARRNKWRRVAIVSPDPGDGKTTIALALAQGMTRQDDARALVLDLDLRRIGLSKRLGARPPVGMETVLAGEAPFARAARRLGTNVALGLNPQASDRPSETLQGAATPRVIEAIEAAYAPDVTLFDLPPLAVAEDNVGFLEKVDAALIVVAAEHTPMSRIDAAERQVADLTNVMGIVLNKCRYPDREGGYGYGYGYGDKD